MKKYYAVVTHNSVQNVWEEIKANSLTGAKRKASAEFGSGYTGHVINLVECNNGIDEKRLNDLPTYTKVTGLRSKWESPK